MDILLWRNRIVCAPCSSGVVSAELGGSALTRHASSSQTSAWASADVGRSLASNTSSFFTHATADGGARAVHDFEDLDPAVGAVEEAGDLVDGDPAAAAETAAEGTEATAELIPEVLA